SSIKISTKFHQRFTIIIRPRNSIKPFDKTSYFCISIVLNFHIFYGVILTLIQNLFKRSNTIKRSICIFINYSNGIFTIILFLYIILLHTRVSVLALSLISIYFMVLS